MYALMARMDFMNNFPNKIKFNATADKAIGLLREKDFWVERIHSGALRNGRSWYDLGSKGLPNVWLPDFNAYLFVTSRLTPFQAAWFSKALAAGIKVAVAPTIEAALEQANQWKNSTSKSI
jgi:hypothetical protein